MPLRGPRPRQPRLSSTLLETCFSSIRARRVIASVFERETQTLTSRCQLCSRDTRVLSRREGAAVCTIAVVLRIKRHQIHDRAGQKISAWKRARPSDLHAMSRHVTMLRDRSSSFSGALPNESRPTRRQNREAAGTRSSIPRERLAVRESRRTRSQSIVRAIPEEHFPAVLATWAPRRVFDAEATRLPESVQAIGVLLTEPNAATGSAADGMDPGDFLHRRRSASTDHDPGPERSRNRQDRSWA
jgi:hypothetical protein